MTSIQRIHSEMDTSQHEIQETIANVGFDVKQGTIIKPGWCQIHICLSYIIVSQ